MPAAYPLGVDAAAPQSRAARVQTLLILGALSAFGPLSIDMYLPALPGLAHDLGDPPSAVQVTLTTCLAGLAVGQILAGPVSDARGRRPVGLAGLLAFTVASALCAAAPSIPVLAGLRLLQGLGGAAAIVIARAVVRDRYSGVAAARYFAILTLVNGLAPVLAPIIGGQLLRVTSWRGVFLVLTGLGVVLLVATAAWLRETLVPERRHTGGLGATLATFARLGRDRRFTGYALSLALGFAAMFAYISGSPFVLQDIYGASPQEFSAVFAVNSLGIMAAGRVSAQLVGRIAPQRLLLAGLTLNVAAGLVLLAVVAAGVGGVVAVLVPLFLVASSIGLILPNATALALELHPEAAGSASGAIGVAQFAVAAALAPLVGAGGATTALPMALVIAGCGVAALAIVPRHA
jgi:DHA1 family bicyclomycin/chloramphenicol resistance-like MFS transporter